MDPGRDLAHMYLEIYYLINHGYWLNGDRHGKGTMYYGSDKNSNKGEMIIAEWKNNFLNGDVTWMMPNGENMLVDLKMV